MLFINEKKDVLFTVCSKMQFQFLGGVNVWALIPSDQKDPNIYLTSISVHHEPGTHFWTLLED